MHSNFFLNDEHQSTQFYTELKISHIQALEILKAVENPLHTNLKSSSSDGLSALELLKAEQLQGYIVTFSAQVDGMLGGGVPLGKITELCGAPGVGKTQFR